MKPLSALRSLWRRQPVAWQLAALVMALVLANAAIVHVAMSLFAAHEAWRLENSLSTPAQRAIRDYKAGSVPAVADAEALLRETEGLDAEVNARGDALLALVIVAAAIADFLLIGFVLLRRLGRGMRAVADTAHRIAAGDLAARVPPTMPTSAEEAQLMHDFNAMAEALQRAERELADNQTAIAHELRTPLTILRGRLQGMADDVFPRDRSGVELLINQVDALTRVVGDLQTLSLLNTDRMVLELVRLDLGDAAASAVAVQAPDLQRAGLKPMGVYACAPIFGDRARIRQAIAAVLHNAERYAHGSGPLRIETCISEGQAQLHIIDQGPGLPPGGCERAFDRFWRADESRARHSGGSGLGLAIVRVIAEAHGGRASIANREEGGAHFTLSLPLAQDRPAERSHP